jgi:hypothetical protein
MKTRKTVFIALIALTPLSTYSQVYNLDFEQWNDSNMVFDNNVQQNGFKIQGSEKGSVNNWSIFNGIGFRTTDAISGDYALVLNDWYAFDDKAYLGEDGVIRISSVTEALECKNCGVAINIKPKEVTGDYKVVSLMLSTNDHLHGEVEAWLTKYDTAQNKRDTTGIGSIILSKTDTNYHSFSFPITYTSTSVMPDTLIFALGFKKWWEGSDTTEYPITCITCHYVYFDNIKLEESVGLNELDTDKKQGNLLIHPNPFNNELTIFNNSAENTNLSLHDVRGRQLQSFSIAPYQNYSVSESNKLPAGCYFLKDAKNTFKLIKQ